MPAALPVHEYGDPHAPPVLLLHPGGARHSVWLPLTRAWRSEYHLLAVDLIGTAGEPLSLEGLAAQVDALIQQLGLPPVWLIGSSLGANVALLAAARASGRVAGLVLDSAQAGGPPPAMLPKMMRLLKSLARLMPPAWVTAALLSQYSQYSPADRLAVRAELQAAGPLIFFEQVEAHFTYDARSALPGISVPTLILAGEFDPLTRAGEPERLRAGLSSSVLNIVPRAGHVTFLRQPAFFQQAAFSFLAAHRSQDR